MTSRLASDGLDQPAEQDLDPQLEIAVELIAHGFKRQVVADRMGVTTRTIWRWLNRPEVQSALAAKKRELAAETSGQLRSLSEGAITVLEGLLGSETESVRLQTAKAILMLGRQARADEILEGLDERIDSLEEEGRRRGQP